MSQKRRPAAEAVGTASTKADALDRAIDGLAGLAGEVRPEHLSKVLAIADRIVEANLAAGLLDAKTNSDIQALGARFHNDTQRADRAAEYLRQFGSAMTSAQQAEVAILIIKVTLGADPSVV